MMMGKHNLWNMAGLDLFLSSLKEDEYDLIENQIIPQDAQIMPLLSWDFYSNYYLDSIKSIKRRSDIEQIANFAGVFNWKNTMESIFDNETFEAIVLTDAKQNIIWVNDGFTNMTGYTKNEVMHRRPNFLQGSETSTATKDSIRENLKSAKPFKEIIRNYKKNNDAYNCEVKIIPLYNESTTHYIALEKRVV